MSACTSVPFSVAQNGANTLLLGHELAHLPQQRGAFYSSISYTLVNTSVRCESIPQTVEATDEDIE